MAKPVLVVVDDEDASLQALAGELESRYGAHYRVTAIRLIHDYLALAPPVREGQ